MTNEHENRRDFLKRASLLAVATPLLVACKNATAASVARTDNLALIRANAITDPSCVWCGAREAPADVSWRSVLQPKSGSDQRMIFSGTVFQADGKTPAPDVLIYFYHTDSDGLYGRKTNGRLQGPLHGHFRGWMLTDNAGRYELSSIRPASYPDSTNPQHIHLTLTSKSRKEDYIDNTLFEGDPYLTADVRAKNDTGRSGSNAVVALRKDSSGIWHGRRDIQMI